MVLQHRRREFLKAASLGAANAVLPLSGFARTAVPTSAGRPNILFIVSDQHRAGLTKRSGYPLDTSPTLDSLAMQGVGCDRAYATAPLCMPSRTTLITGRWPEAHRVRQNSGARDAVFNKDLFDVVKAAGYKTGLAGKNHTYLRPEKLDFWREYTHLGGWKPANAPKEVVEYDRWLKQVNRDVSHHPTPFPVETQLPYRIVSDAIVFMGLCGDQPFALEVSFPEPHNPYQVPKPYWDMYPPEQVPPRCIGPEALKDKGFRWQWEHALENNAFPGYDRYWRRLKSNYLGMLRLLDDQLARLTGFMKQREILEKTIIVYVADHGDYLTEYGLMRKGVGMPEALIRIPMVWSGWGIQGGRPHEQAFVSMADVMPTFCEAIGAEIPHGVQGRSLWPILQGKDYPYEEFRSIYAGVGFGGLYYDASDHVPFSIAESTYPGPGGRTFDELNPVSQSGYMKMVRMGDWKLLYDMMGYGQLYHLPSDPCEMKNLFGDPSVASEQAELMAELLMWTIRSEDTLPTNAYKTKWPGKHNWYAPYRHRSAPEAFIP
jgi:arylsulfatase A-like enzyme